MDSEEDRRMAYSEVVGQEETTDIKEVVEAC
jgi:hypothetical protein